MNFRSNKAINFCLLHLNIKPMIECMETTTQIVILMLFNNTIDLANKISLIYIYLQNIYTTFSQKMKENFALFYAHMCKKILTR